jgi:PhnB protein
MAAKPIPAGYHSVTPYLITSNAAAAIDFYKQAFGATEVLRMTDGAGKIGHAEIKIGDSPVMLADEFPEMGIHSPASQGCSGVYLLIYVEEVDAVAGRAIGAGASVLRPVQDQWYGDRSGTFADPFGHIWTIATHKEDLTPDELNRRAAAARG